MKSSLEAEIVSDWLSYMSNRVCPWCSRASLFKNLVNILKECEHKAANKITLNLYVITILKGKSHNLALKHVAFLPLTCAFEQISKFDTFIFILIYSECVI